MAARLVLLGLLALAGGCDDDGPAPGQVAWVSPSGDPFAFGEPVVTRLGKQERFRHRFRFRAIRQEPVRVFVETTAMVLTASIGPRGERPFWRKGPQSVIRDRFTPNESGVYDLVVEGDGLTYENSYRLVLGVRRR